MGRKRIGIVGCGAIGGGIARAVDSGAVDAELAGLCDEVAGAADALSGALSCRPRVMGLAELVDASDIVVECARVEAVAGVADECLRRGRALVAMSVGGVTPEIVSRFAAGGSDLYVPSGAVCGLDGVLAAAAAGIDSITLTTTKPPAGLKGAPHLERAGIDVDTITAATVVFEGTAAEAIAGFPKNVNVAATLALASGAGDKLVVKVVADPGSPGNVHEINLRGAAGSISVKVENVPSAVNPRTSALAYYSAVALLKKITSHVKAGT